MAAVKCLSRDTAPSQSDGSDEIGQVTQVCIAKVTLR